MLGDVQIAEPGALICFAGPRVIEQTIRETLPEGFQRAEYLLDHGMLDRVVARKDLREEIATLLAAPDQPAALCARRPARAAPAEEAPARRRMTPTERPRPRAPDLAASQGDRPVARPHRAAARGARPPGAAAAAGDPRRRHQRQGLGRGDAARRARGRRAPGARLYLAASRALPRAHPARRRADRRGPAVAERSSAARRRTPARRSPSSRSPPRRPSSRWPRRRRTSRCSRSGSAAGSTPPTSIDRPRLTVITPVSLDHQQYLGETLAEIAGEKAGILKHGRPLHRRPAGARGARGDRGAGRRGWWRR